MNRWRGKLAIVTGASRGIGASVVQNLVESGVNVVGVARSIEQMQQMQAELKSLPAKFYPMQCDVTKEEEILNVFHKVESTLGGVDILINNAAAIVYKPMIGM